MNNFSIVFKVLFSRIFASKRKKSQKSFVGLLIGIGCLFAFLSAMYNNMFFDALIKAEHPEYYPLLLIAISFILTMSTSIYRTSSLLFSTKDHNVLTPLPIKKSTIISVNLLLFYLEEIIYSIFIFLPGIVFYSIYFKYFWFGGLLLMLLVPLSAVLFSVAIGFLITLLSHRFRFFKIISTILYFLIFIAIMAVSFLISSNDNPGSDLTFVCEKLNKLFLFNWFYEGTTAFDLLKLTYCIAISTVSLILLILLYALFYEQFYGALIKTENKKKFVKEQIKTSKVFKSLLYNNFKQLTSSTFLLMNSLCGCIISIIATISISLQIKTNPVTEEDIQAFFWISSFLPFVIGYLSAITCISCFSISLEKNNFWMIKTLPIDKKKYFLAKIFLDYFIVGTMTLIASIIACILSKPTPVGIVFTILLPQLMVLMNILYATLIAIKYPKLDWDTYNQLKNSKSAMIYTFSSMGIHFGLAIPYAILLILFKNSLIVFVVFTLIFIGFVALYASIIFKNASKHISKIEI